MDLADVWLGGPPLAGRGRRGRLPGHPRRAGERRGDRERPPPTLLAARTPPARAREGRRHGPLRPAAAARRRRGSWTPGRRSSSGSGPGSTRSSGRAGRRRSSPRSATGSGPLRRRDRARATRARRRASADPPALARVADDTTLRCTAPGRRQPRLTAVSAAVQLVHSTVRASAAAGRIPCPTSRSPRARPPSHTKP